MTRTEHLLVILAEECNEVAQRCTKALRFGLEEIQLGQELANKERIVQEFADLLAVAEMLQDAGAIGAVYESALRPLMDAKIVKVEHFLKLSRDCGTLEDG